MAPLLFWYGRFLMLLKRRSRALEVFRAATQADPRHRRAWSAIGVLLAARGELPPAIEAFEQAVRLDPSGAAAHFNVAFLLQCLGRHDQAIPRFERGLELSTATRGK